MFHDSVFESTSKKVAKTVRKLGGIAKKIVFMTYRAMEMANPYLGRLDVLDGSSDVEGILTLDNGLEYISRVSELAQQKL